MVWAIVIILLVAADQLLKLLVKTNVEPTGQITVIDGFFHIINRKNTGAAWSFLAGQEWGLYLLASVSAIITIVILVVLYRSTHVKLQACLTIICAGSIGNLIDRIRDRGVTDFLDFHFGSYIFPTFNLADMCIVCGTILLCLLILLDPDLLQSIGGFTKGNSASKKEVPHAPDHSD